MLYKKLVSTFLDHRDSETWHVRARELLHSMEGSRCGSEITKVFSGNSPRYANEKLRVSIGNVEFENPLIVGAGWDKAGRAVRGLWQMGFAGVEVGSVLARSQPGNPKPRQFILAPGVALNWLGFNSHGMDVVEVNLERYKDDGIPIGLSVGENKDLAEVDSPEPHAEAYAIVVKKLYRLASWVAINVSSPNTPKLRRLQGKEWLVYIVKEVINVMEQMGGRKLMFVKVAPDLTREQLDGVIEVVLDYKLGIEATNTTNNSDIKAKYGECWRNEQGGLSGDDPDFRRMSTETIAYIYHASCGRIPIFGIGGVKDTGTALEKIMAGGRALQLVTALRGEGPCVAGNINGGLVNFMDKEGVKSIQEFVGVNAHLY